MTELEAALAAFLPGRRWFAGKGREIDEVRIEAAVALRDALPAFEVVAAAVAHADGGVDRYQLPLGRDRGEGARAMALRAPGAVVLGPAGPAGEVVYDAVHDERLGAVLLEHLAGSATVGGLRFHRAPGFPGELPRQPARLLGVEQSNSSLVFGERLLLKLFRRLEPGENPELEVTRALAASGFRGCAPPLAWFEGFGSTLGILQPFLAGAVEGWQLATARATAFYEDRATPDGFVAESRELGVVTAELHAKLAEALPVAADRRVAGDGLVAGLCGQLARAAAVVPEVARERAAAESLYARAGAAAGAAPLQRIHGDYHLGQVMRVGGRWVVMDFEGEPARGLAERRRPASPLRDVAGMLRSFDYAAFQPLALDGRFGSDGLDERARLWAERCRGAFLDAYLERAGGLGDRGELLLAAFELDKAVYEVLYEAGHRPAWLPIPLGGIRRVLERATIDQR